MRKIFAVALFLLLGMPALSIERGSIRSQVFAQTGGTCGTAAHCSSLSWTASPSASGCASPCTFGYNVYRGTAAGAENTTPINSSLVTTTSYIDPVTLTSSSQTFFYYVKAVETSGSVTALSTASNEVSDTFPGVPAPASGLSVGNN